MIDYDKLMNWRFEDTPHVYGATDTMLYVRIPMKAATDSDGKRPPVPIQNGHFGRGSNWAS